MPIFIQKIICEIRRQDPEKSKYEIQAQLKNEDIVIGQSAIQHVINKYFDLKCSVRKTHTKTQGF